jgi:hypothetical protein
LDRRCLDTALTHVEYETDVDASLPRLRRTDLVYRDSPTRVVAVLYGAGPVGARTALARCGITEHARMRPATGDDLLLATGPATRPAKTPTTPETPTTTES